MLLLLLPLLPLPAVHLGDLQDGQPDLVVAPGDRSRATGAGDSAVRLAAAAATPVYFGSLVNFCIL